MKKSNFKKLLALLLIAAMAVSMLSVTAFAENETEQQPSAQLVDADKASEESGSGEESDKGGEPSGSGNEDPASAGEEKKEDAQIKLSKIKVWVDCVNEERYTGKPTGATETPPHVSESYQASDLQSGTYTVFKDGDAYKLTLSTDKYVHSDTPVSADPGTSLFVFDSWAHQRHIAVKDTITVDLAQGEDGSYAVAGSADNTIRVQAVCEPQIKGNVKLTVVCDSDGPKHSLTLGNQYLTVQIFGYEGCSVPMRTADGGIQWSLTLNDKALNYVANIVYSGLADVPEDWGWGFGYLNDYGKHTLSVNQPEPLNVTFSWNGEKWVADKDELKVHVVCKYMPEGWTDLYVADWGNDDTNPGTQAAPLATLAKAAELINDAEGTDYTVYVMTNLTSTACARFYNKNVTITSYGEKHTVSRGDGFATIADNARSFYNPAMIEIQETGGSPSLTLRNIVFDDCEKHMGIKFSQASSDGKGGNGDIVQDAIIASNATTSCTINIESDAELRNFGGMSAVRVTDKAHVNMNGTISGSATPQRGGGNGPAGAIWIQGGSAYVGGTITGLTGRAVYIDGGSATVAGTISNITGDNNAWQGQSGVAIHVRGGGYAVLSETGKIDTIKGNGGGYTGAVMTNGSRGEGLYDFEAKPGSVISGVSGFPTVYSNYGTELLNGTITGCSHDFVIGGFAQKTTIGPEGVIENCIGSGGAAQAIVYTSNASMVYLYGKVRNNTASHAFYIINQSGGGASLDMYNGAEITNTTGEGVYVNASESAFYMHGGTISGNGSYGAQIREKGNRSSIFVMDGGSIINNGSYGVYYNGLEGSGNAQGHVDINGGEVSGNGSAQIYISGSYARNDKVRAHIAPGVIKAANGKGAAISTYFGTLTLDANYAEINLGNAKSAAENKIKELVKAHESEEAYITRGYSALWFRPTENTLHFTVPRSSSINKSNFLYAAYIPLNADGTPAADAALAVKQLNNTDPINVSLDGLTPDQPYALMLMQPNDEATGAIQLTGTPGVSEVLGQESYEVDYTFTYEPKNVYSSISEGDEFTATVQLDSNLTYVEDSMQFESSYYEQVGTPVYDADAHQVSVTFKVVKKVYSFSSATISLKASFTPALFDEGVSSLSTTATLESKLATGGKVELKTNLPCVTRLNPLPTYTVAFDSAGGSAVESQTVKQGAQATEPADPELYFNDFDGWYLGETEYDFDTPVTANITLTAHWHHTHVFGAWTGDANSHWRVCPYDGAVTDIGGHTYGEWTVTAAPTTEATGAQQHTCTVCGHVETMVLDRIPAIAAIPGVPAPVAPYTPETIDAPETPLADEQVEDIDDEITPQSEGHGLGCIIHWIILAAALVLLVVYIASAENEKKKIKALKEQLGL